jgi:hypothetical protein
MAKSSARQFLVKVAGIDGYFMTKSGGSISADANKVYDGGSLVPDVLAGPAEADNVTVSRAYDPTRDATLLARLRRDVGRFTTTVSVTPTDRDLVAVGTPVVYSNALLVGVTEPDSDASSGDAATYELEFAVGSFT